MSYYVLWILFTRLSSKSIVCISTFAWYVCAVFYVSVIAKPTRKSALMQCRKWSAGLVIGGTGNPASAELSVRIAIIYYRCMAWSNFRVFFMIIICSWEDYFEIGLLPQQPAQRRCFSPELADRAGWRGCTPQKRVDEWTWQLCGSLKTVSWCIWTHLLRQMLTGVHFNLLSMKSNKNVFVGKLKLLPDKDLLAQVTCFQVIEVTAYLTIW